jgi:hypothetical protein
MIKNQEITDANTGVHLVIGTTGEGKDAVSGAEINPRHWVRITSPAVTTPGPNAEPIVVKPQTISTIYFGAQGDVARIAAHDLTAPPAPAPVVDKTAADLDRIKADEPGGSPLSPEAPLVKPSKFSSRPMPDAPPMPVAPMPVAPPTPTPYFAPAVAPPAPDAPPPQVAPTPVVNIDPNE